MMTTLPADSVGTGQVMSGSTDCIINTFMAHFAEVEVDMLSGAPNPRNDPPAERFVYAVTPS
ncbi:hypothetical protein C2W62_46460 [Candidatus Entotheonella serta]|nr:hypothetical protein C2W62_46460 [Candidatus Entotheonella serta]